MTSHLTPLQLETVLTEGNTAKFWMVGVLLSLSTCNDTTAMNVCLSTKDGVDR